MQRAARAVNVRFLLGIALPVGVAALLAALRRDEPFLWPALLNIVLWLATIAILAREVRVRRAGATPRPVQPVDPKPRRAAPAAEPHDCTTPAALSLVACVAVLSFYHFGRFHLDGHFVHYHDVYHYYMNAKYFGEVSHDRLYAATHAALVENERAFVERLAAVRNLRSYELEGQAVALQRSASAVQAFSAERWRQFKEDVRFFQGRMGPDQWQLLLLDYGFNGTPFWRLIGGALASRVSLGELNLFLLSLLDVLLIAAALGLVWYAFDLTTCLLATIFFFANFFATFDITGGGFLRMIWVAGLIGGICLLHRRRWVWGAQCLAAAALDRAFPVVFVLPALVAFVSETVRRRSWRHEQAGRVAALGGAFALLGGLSLLGDGGLSAWREWYAKIQVHNRAFYTNQIALRNLFVVNPISSYRLATEGWDEGLWRRQREQRDAASRYTLAGVRLALLAALLTVLSRPDRLARALSLLAFAPFLFFYPSNYYGVFFVVPLLFWRAAPGLVLTLLGTQAVFWALGIMLWTPMHAELLNYLVAATLALVFCGFLFIELRKGLARRGARSGLRWAAPLAGLGAILVGVLADLRAARTDLPWVSVDLAPSDVRAARGVAVQREDMTPWGIGWAKGDHVVGFVGGDRAQAVFGVQGRRAGAYRVRVEFTAGPPFGVVTVSVNGNAYPPVDCYAPQVQFRPVVYESVALMEGRNAVTVTSVGRHPAASGQLFALDRIVLRRAESAPKDAIEQSAACRVAVEQAVGWLDRNAADALDGGRDAVRAEILALDVLASRPALAGLRSAYLRRVAKRFAALRAIGDFRTNPDEYEGIAAAASVARQVGIDDATYSRLESDMHDWLRANPDTALALPLSLHMCRLGAPGAAIQLEQGWMAREFEQRLLSRMLSGGVDAGRAPVLASALEHMVSELQAWTRWGRDLPPDVALLGDAGFWAELCTRAMEWARALSDVSVMSDALLLAQGLRLEERVPAYGAGVAFLLAQQQEDGSFGPGNPRSVNVARDPLLRAVMALSGAIQ
jgi:hypothetical protein